MDRLEHSLQSATRAYRDGADEEMVVAALLHDIGDLLSPYNHSEMAAAVLRPYVSEKTHWIVRHHGLFQSYYYAHHTGGDRNARDAYRDHPWYQDTVDFCHKWDQSSFDPDYESLPLEFFEPMVRRIFAREPFSEARTGRVGYAIAGAARPSVPRCSSTLAEAFPGRGGEHTPTAPRTGTCGRSGGSSCRPR